MFHFLKIKNSKVFELISKLILVGFYFIVTDSAFLLLALFALVHLPLDQTRPQGIMIGGAVYTIFSCLLVLLIFFGLYTLLSRIKKLLYVFLSTFFIVLFSYFMTYRDIFVDAHVQAFILILVVYLLFLSATITWYWEEIYIKKDVLSSYLLVVALGIDFFIMSSVYSLTIYISIGEYLNTISHYTYNIFYIDYAGFSLLLAYFLAAFLACVLLLCKHIFYFANPHTRFIPKWMGILFLVVFLSIFGIFWVKDVSNIKSQQPSQKSMYTPQPTKNDNSIIRLNVDVVIPKGWIKTIEVRKFPVGDNRRYEFLVVKKGEYTLNIGTISTGLGSCDFYQEKQFVQLHNKYIADFVVRQKPTKENQVVSICRKMDDGSFQADTPFGIIDYFLPNVWDEKIVTEMDAIVASLHPLLHSADWKRYTNTQYGYSYQYPQQWSIKEATAAPILSSQYLTSVHKRSDNTSPTISINLQNKSIDQEKELLNYSSGIFLIKSQITTEIFKGKEVVKAVMTSSEFDKKTNTYVQTGKSYQILIPMGTNTLSIFGDLTDKKTIDKIFSTLKLTNQEQNASS